MTVLDLLLALGIACALLGGLVSFGNLVQGLASRVRRGIRRRRAIAAVEADAERDTRTGSRRVAL